MGCRCTFTLRSTPGARESRPSTRTSRWRPRSTSRKTFSWAASFAAEASSVWSSGWLSGSQRQGVAVARAAAFASRVVIMDEPTAALGVKESGQVLELIREVRAHEVPVVLISHNMPQVFEIADRVHIMRLGRRVATITPQTHTMAEAVALMTGATSFKSDN